MSDLATDYLGLSLRTPLVASPSPLTGRVDSLVRLEEAGAAAVVLPSLFEEELVGESMALHEQLESHTHSFAEAVDFFPAMDFEDLGPDRHVRLVEEAKARLEIPVIASVNAQSPGTWLHYARLMSDAGADAVEINLYAVAADPHRDAMDLEDEWVEMVREVCAAVDVPVAVKLGPQFTALANFVGRVVDAGASGLVLFNRFYQPDLDLETLDLQSRVDLSDSRDLRLPLRWIGLLRPQLKQTYLALTSGVHTSDDAAKALLAGADVVMMTSALLRNGPEHLSWVEAGLTRWMVEREYSSVSQLRGSVSRHGARDPSAYERANYVKVLASYHV
jgi:dihydroorotate dehydrogenase (fumarate)